MRLKSTSKGKQKEFIEHLKDLFDNPSELVPECVDGGMFCNFSSYRKKIDIVAQSEAYERYAKTADQFLSGLSETYRIMDSDSAPIFGMVKTPYGSVEYAKRGTTDENVLAGIQHYDHTLWRMLAFSSLARSKGVRVYSSSNHYIGSCKNTSPGIEFFKDALRDENIQFEEKDGEIVIPGSGFSMEITHLNSMKFTFYDNSSYHLVHSLLKHMITPDISRDFTFRSDFLEDYVKEIPQQPLSLYIAGKINDRTFLREVHDFRISESVKRGYFIVGDRCYTSPEEFVSENSFKYVPEDIIIDSLVTRGKGLSMDTFSERKVLETIWSSVGAQILKDMFPDLDDSIISSLKGSPMDQIDEINERTRIDEIKSDIDAESWSPDSKYLVDTLKNYFTLGKEKCLREAEKGSGHSNIRKAIFYAILDSLGESRNREWQFTDTERDLAWKIKPYIQRILKEGSSAMTTELENIKVFVR